MKGVFGIKDGAYRMTARESEYILIETHTPGREDGSLDIEELLDTCGEVGRELQHSEEVYPVVLVISLVNPGDMDARFGPTLERSSGRKIGQSLGLAYCSEPRSEDYVIAGTDGSGRTMEKVSKYLLHKRLHFMTFLSAEFARLGRYALAESKLALMGQLSWMCHLTKGADARDVMSSLYNKDPSYLRPGTPSGGPDLPRGNRALVYTASRLNVPASVAAAVDQFRNWQMSALCFHLGTVWQKYGCKRIGILGMVFTPNTDIIEESPGVALLSAINDAIDQGLELEVQTVDPALDEAGKYADVLEWADFLIIMTPWPEFTTLNELSLPQTVIFDMWGMLDPKSLRCLTYIRFGEGEI